MFHDDQSSIFVVPWGLEFLPQNFKLCPAICCDGPRWPCSRMLWKGVKVKQAVSPAKSLQVGRFVCDHPAFGDIEFGHSIFSSGKRSPQESEEGNESYCDRSLRFNILYVMWLVSNCMFFTAEINGDSLRSLADMAMCGSWKKACFLQIRHLLFMWESLRTGDNGV
jgi:hypothetical protein